MKCKPLIQEVGLLVLLILGAYLVSLFGYVLMMGLFYGFV